MPDNVNAGKIILPNFGMTEKELLDIVEDMDSPRFWL
jgi:hypothetical protein